MNNFQRKGSISNAHVGNVFEDKIKSFFSKQGIELSRGVALDIGVDGKKKKHKFDLGNLENKIIVECKSHTWTVTENVPSAKITTWDQAMYFFMRLLQSSKRYLSFLNILVPKEKRRFVIITYARMII